MHIGTFGTYSINKCSNVHKLKYTYLERRDFSSFCVHFVEPALKVVLVLLKTDNQLLVFLKMYKNKKNFQLRY